MGRPEAAMSEYSNRKVALRTVANVRDLGGLPVDGGVVIPGRVFRSATLERADETDQQAITELGIGVIYDLRTQAERADAPSRVPEDVRVAALDVLADSRIADLMANVGQFFNNPAGFAGELRGGRGEAVLEDSYRDIVRLPSARSAYRSLFEDLADPARGGAALIHCTSGKDRTGWAAASLLSLLGADDATIRADYLQTNEDILPTLQPILERVSAAGVDPEMILPILTVQNSYLDAAYDEMDSLFGGIENYFTNGLGLGGRVIESLQVRLIG